jgi:hypothetical protein
VITIMVGTSEVVIAAMAVVSLLIILWFLKVKHIHKGINPSSVNQIYFRGDYLLKGARIGIVAGMVALTVR